MRIDAPRTPEPRTREAASTAAAREVAPKRTVAKPSEIKKAIATAYQRLHGKPIGSKMLDVLSAQACNETGLGASMFNFNFGGIKGSSPQGMTARCKTTEILGGEEKHIVDGFRAYGSLTDGATDYVRFLEKRFPKAVEAAEKGDVSGFVGHLKAGHYFTADEGAYAGAVQRLLGATDDMAPGVTASSSVASKASFSGISSFGGLDGMSGIGAGTGGFADTTAMSRVFDALSASSASIAAPMPDEDDA